jgi:hypothetical protein
MLACGVLYRLITGLRSYRLAEASVAVGPGGGGIQDRPAGTFRIAAAGRAIQFALLACSRSHLTRLSRCSDRKPKRTSLVIADVSAQTGRHQTPDYGRRHQCAALDGRQHLGPPKWL